MNSTHTPEQAAQALRDEEARLKWEANNPYKRLNEHLWRVDEANRIREGQQMKLARGGWPLRV